MANFDLLLSVMSDLKNSIDMPPVDVKLWSLRASTAKKLYRNVIHPANMDSFAVIAMTKEQTANEPDPSFEVTTQVLQGLGFRVVLKGSSPSATTAALKWYLKQVCGVDPDVAKNAPLRAPLPHVVGGYKAIQKTTNGVKAWVEASKSSLVNRFKSNDSHQDSNEGAVFQDRLASVMTRLRHTVEHLHACGKLTTEECSEIVQQLSRFQR